MCLWRSQPKQHTGFCSKIGVQFCSAARSPYRHWTAATTTTEFIIAISKKLEHRRVELALYQPSEPDLRMATRQQKCFCCEYWLPAYCGLCRAMGHCLFNPTVWRSSVATQTHSWAVSTRNTFHLFQNPQLSKVLAFEFHFQVTSPSRDHSRAPCRALYISRL